MMDGCAAAVSGWRVATPGGLAMYRAASAIHCARRVEHAVGYWAAMGHCQSAWWQLKSPTMTSGSVRWAEAAASTALSRTSRVAVATLHLGGRYTTASRKAARCRGRTTAHTTAEEAGWPGTRGGSMSRQWARSGCT